MSEQHKALLLAGNDAIRAGNYDAFADQCTEDTEWVIVGDRTLRGPEAVRAYMRTAYAVPPVFTVDLLIAEGEHLTALGHITLTDEKGSATSYAYCDVWRFRDGKIAGLKAFVLPAGG
ncbi:nuclear transport factor 2 family protein [Flaviaesturariibacter amylovorans]|uniref:SnoaL-like domain-containing protein n=1 Tax=Flaviaesturariibacter amylovorans TaxID=1084520 RepID=A0ABP8HP66_9BACT